jgi:hypothetical protein
MSLRPTVGRNPLAVLLLTLLHPSLDLKLDTGSTMTLLFPLRLTSPYTCYPHPCPLVLANLV